jgi:hypothetical protein
LQDNDSWCGPSASFVLRGISNDEWMKVGGGDGLGGHLKTGQSGSPQNRPVERVQDSHSFTPSVTLSARVFRFESLFRR